MRPVWRYSGRAVGAAAGLLTALPLYCLSAQDSVRISEAQTVLAHLVETYGVSGAEEFNVGQPLAGSVPA